MSAGLRRLRAALACLFGLTAMALALPSRATDTSAEVVVFAAGSLRGAITHIAEEFHSEHGVPVKTVFGASGLLRDRIAGGERADVFASANMEHPQALERSGLASQVLPFTRNALCALAGPAFAADDRDVLTRLVDPRFRLGISTPKADPSGDYAFELFERIERHGGVPAGTGRALQQRALQLTGGPQSPPPPKDRNVYGVLVAEGQADVFITYCTNAVVAVQEQPALRALEIPASVNVSAIYGVARMRAGGAWTDRFIAHLLGPRGQQRLAELGFSPP